MKIKYTLPLLLLGHVLCLQAEIRHFRFSRHDADPEVMTRIVSIEKVTADSVTAWANDREWKAFTETQTPFRILPPDKGPKMSDMTLEDPRETGWTKYPTYPAYLQLMASYKNEFPDICRIDTLGTSVEGRLLLAAHLSAGADTVHHKPAFLYTAQIHGNEIATSVLMLRLIDTLLTAYHDSTEFWSLLENTDIRIIPLLNPDGAYAGGDSTLAESTRHNANEEDLNRNFPDPVHVAAPNTAVRQPETLALMAYVEEKQIRISAGVHAGNECVNYPWDSTPERHPETGWFLNVSHAYADTVRYVSPEEFFNGFDRGVTNGWDWYSIYGGLQDYMTFYHRSKEITLEISHEKSPDGETLPELWNYHKRSLLMLPRHLTRGIRAEWKDTPPHTLEIVSPCEVNIPVKEDYSVFYYPLLEGSYDFCLHYADTTDTLKNIPVHENGLTDILKHPVHIAESTALPHDFSLSPPYPNPFNPATRFTLSLPTRGHTEIRIYDIRGRHIQTLHTGFLSAGQHVFIWNGTDHIGKEVASGIYLIDVQYKRGSVQQKAVLIR